MKMSDQRVVLLLYMLFVGWIGFFSYTFYLEEEKTLNRQINNQLSSIADGATMLLPKEFHDEVYTGKSITPEEDEYNIDRFTKLAKSFHVAYIYTAMVRDGNVIVTASSAMDDAVSGRKNILHFGTNLNEMNQSINKALKTNEAVFDEVRDHRGEFKCAIVPFMTTNGGRYVSVAEIDTSALESILRTQGIKHLIFALGIALVSLPLFLYRYKQIKKIAFMDTLTGLPNRFEFQNKASFLLNMAKRNSSSFALMYLDLDGFKNVNDTLGHDAGDKLLIDVANRLSGALRQSDIASRQGGDEFVVLLPDADRPGAEKAAQKILNEVANPYLIKNQTINVTFSIGIAMYPSDGDDLNVLSKKADEAMYEAKRSGKNCFKISGGH